MSLFFLGGGGGVTGIGTECAGIFPKLQAGERGLAEARVCAGALGFIDWF